MSLVHGHPVHKELHKGNENNVHKAVHKVVHKAVHQAVHKVVHKVVHKAEGAIVHKVVHKAQEPLKFQSSSVSKYLKSVKRLVIDAQGVAETSQSTYIHSCSRRIRIS